MNKNLMKTIRELILFASPIAFGQVSQMFIGLGDVFIAGHHGTRTVAAIGIANSISSPIFLIGLGLLLGISPTLSRKRGEFTNVEQYFYTCITYAVGIGIIFMLLTMAMVPLIPYFGFDKSIVPLIQDYLFIVSFSYFGSYIFIAIKEYLQSSENVIFANSVSFIAIFVNLLFGYTLAFGLFIFPELGVRGLAYAAIIVRSLTGITLFIYSRKSVRTSFTFVGDFVKHIFKFSIPISMSIFAEVLAFSAVMILIGRLSPLNAAIHNIAYTIACTTYMIPLSISSAVSVKVAYFYGRRNFDRIRDFVKASLTISMTFMACAGLILCFLPKMVLGIFTSDQEVIMAGASIIIVCGLFEIFDGAQVTLSGILRGLGLTKPTFIVVLAGYWLVGIPLGYYLGYIKHMYVFGFWIGLAITLLLIAIGLFSYLQVVLKRESATFTKKV